MNENKEIKDESKEIKDKSEEEKLPATRLMVVKNEVLAGLTTSFAMVPEVVAFAFVAGVNPLVGLYAAFVVGLITAAWGGRPGMISGGAGSLAVVSVSLVTSHGAGYLFAAVLLMGGIQALIGILGWGKFIRLVPHPVMLGFVNGLAVVILMAQVRQFEVSGAGGHLYWSWGPPLWVMLGITALTVAMMVLLPRITRAFPAALGAIAAVTLGTHFFGVHTKTVSDLASIHCGLPAFRFPAVPLTWQTLTTVLPYAGVLAGVGLTETLLTQNLIDELTETPSSPDRECIGQGLGNLACGLFGGMGGCAMIGQSMINIASGGRGRLSGIVEALSILSFIVFASALIGSIPMAALIGVMLVVVCKTFAWSSLRLLHRIPRADAFVLVLVSVVTVFTNLATAVFVGVLISCLVFAWESAARMDAQRFLSPDGSAVYEIHGPLFFGSIRSFQELFDLKNDPGQVIVDFRYSRVQDHSALEAVHALSLRYRNNGKTLHLRHLSLRCQRILAQAGDTVDVNISPNISPDPHTAAATKARRTGVGQHPGA